MNREYGICVSLKVPEAAGIYLAEIDMDMLREYREHAVMGEKYRHPEKNGILVNGGK